MTNEEMIAEVRRKVAVSEGVKHLWEAPELARDLATALEAAQTRIAELEANLENENNTLTATAQREQRLIDSAAELEAQAAEITGHLKRASQSWYDAESKCHICFAETHTDSCPLRPFSDFLANLPAAVQRHLEKDRAAKDLADELWKFRLALQGQGLTHLIQKLAAYRAVGGEG